MLRQGEDVDHAHVDARGDDQLDRARARPAMSSGGSTLPNGITAKMASAAARIESGRQDVQRLVDVGRRVLFLEDELQAVGQRLAEAEQLDLRQRNADAIGPEAVLHPGGDPALEQHEVGRRGHQAADQDSAILTRGIDQDGGISGVQDSSTIVNRRTVRSLRLRPAG